MSDKPQLFGTDGLRGVAGEYPLDRKTVWKLGCALGMVLEKTAKKRPLRVVLGEDTRESSAWISRTLAAGLGSREIEVVYAGVITTPGVVFLTRHHGFACGVVVSASHNPYQDNGIKVFSQLGMKLPDSVELEIEQALGQLEVSEREPSDQRLEPDTRLLDHYVEYLQNLVPDGIHLSKYRLVADCAHGAASRVIPVLLRKLGVEARILHAQPNGRNINQDSGSLHPRILAEATQSTVSDLGVAFDGDADRAIFATCNGRIADGDHILYVAATFFNQYGLLKGGGVVGTLMTNLGLELALARHGIALKRTGVGDKYVLEEMLRSGINLGGEPSGHIIFADLSLAGDGIITLLQVLRFLAETRKPLTELVRGLQPLPQIIRNVRVRQKLPLESIPEVAEAIAECRQELGEQGRVVVRYSGTEPVARVMVEGERAETVERHAARVAEAIDSVLGSR